MSERSFGVRFQLPENQRGNFLGRILMPVCRDAHRFAWRALEFIENLSIFVPQFIATQTHETLDRIDGLRRREPAHSRRRWSDERHALRREMDDRWSQSRSVLVRDQNWKP